MSNNKEGIGESVNTYDKLNDVYGKIHVLYEEVIKKGIHCSRSIAKRSSLVRQQQSGLLSCTSSVR